MEQQQPDERSEHPLALSTVLATALKFGVTTNLRPQLYISSPARPREPLEVSPRNGRRAP